MTESTKTWFIEKLAQNPEYLAHVYLPELERRILRSQTALDQATRNDGIEKIKYHMGFLDGVREISLMVEGLRIAENQRSNARNPVETGLMSRIRALANLTPG